LGDFRFRPATYWITCSY